MELGLDNFVDAEQLFGRCLMTVPNVRLWTVYLNYIRRRNDLTNDTSGTARTCRTHIDQRRIAVVNMSKRFTHPPEI